MIEEQIAQTRMAVEANSQDFAAWAKWGEMLLELAMLKQVPKETVCRCRNMYIFR